MNLVEVSVHETRHNVVLVLIDLVIEEVFILLHQIFQLLTHTIVRVDREAGGPQSLHIPLVHVGELVSQVANDGGTAQLGVHLQEP